MKKSLFPKMNLKTATAICFIGLICVLSACRKKGDNEDLNVNNNQTSNSLIPSDSGSWWLLRGIDSTMSWMFATGIDTQMNGGTYQYFKVQDTITGEITPYFYAKNDDYYLRLMDITQGQGQYVPAIICTVTPKQGDTWENTSQVQYNGVNINVKMNGSVLTIDSSLTINGHVYNNVIETYNQIKAKIAGTPTWFNCGHISMSIVKGVGVIKSDLQISILNFFNSQSGNTVVDYHIE